MAQAVKTVYTYNLDGTKKDFNIPFEYLARKFIRVTLIGKDRKILTLNQDYRFSTKTTITTTQAWGATQGYNYIEIRRYTSATERLVDFTDGSILRAYDLNVSQLQTIHVAEEARDLTADTIGVNNNGDLDARGRRIVNLGNAVDDRDAVPLGQIKGINQNAWTARDQAEQFKNQAKGFRDEAEVSRNAAEAAKARAGASELKAKDWASKDGIVEGGLKSAKSYAQEAKTSEVNAQTAQNGADESRRHASNSQAAAAISQDAADKARERAEKWAQEAPNVPVVGNRYSAYHWSTVAKTEANKLGNWNALAGQVDLVDGNTVAFKQRLAARNYTVRVDANGEGTAAGVIQFQGTRSAGQKEFYYETYANFSKKRNDIYTFQATDPATWPTGRSAGNGKHSLKGDVEVTKALTVTGPVISPNADNYRIAYGGYGTFWRNDGQRLYLMMTNKGEPYGSWNNFRPFYADLTTGRVTLGSGLVGDLVQHSGKYQNTSTPGAGAFAAQLNAEAAYSHHLPGNQDGNVYYPMMKQYGRRSNGYPTAFSMGMTSRGSNGFHSGSINLIGDNNNNRTWHFDMNGYFYTAGLNSTTQIQSVMNGANYLCQTAGNVENQACYVLGQAGGNNWYIGKGGADNNITLHSYKLNTNIILTANSVNANKTIISSGELQAAGGKARVAGDGNVYGTKWGGWLDAWVNTHCKRKLGSWTTLMQGATGHGVSKALSQDIRFRQCWFLINGHWMPVAIGPDATYYVSGWGNGWIKFKISNNGRTFTNIEDSGTVPTQIVAANE